MTTQIAATGAARLARKGDEMMAAKPAPFLREQPKKAQPKTYKRWRVLIREIVLPERETQLSVIADAEGRPELFRSRKEALRAGLGALERTGGLVIEEVAVVAKRETRYEEVER